MQIVKIDESILNTLQALRAAFPERCYVGGSFARQQCLGDSYTFNDIDVFILGPRSCEMWITEIILREIFDNIELTREIEGNNDRYDLIEGQFAHIIGYKDGRKYDLLFINERIEHIISDQTCSSYSKFYYAVTYNPQVLQLVQHSHTNLAIISIVAKRICEMNGANASHEHIKKIQLLCDEHDIKMITKVCTVSSQHNDDL